jgi:mannosyltransferase
VITRARKLSSSCTGARLIQIGAVCLAGFALRGWWLDRQSFWLDEGFSAALTSGPLWYILQQSFTKEPNPPFYFLLLHLWRFPAGSTEFAIRFLSVVPSGAAIPVVYGIGRRLAGHRAGLLAAILAAANAYLVWLAQEARMYSWALLWTVLGAHFLVKALQTGRRLDWWLCFAANLLAVYTHLYSVFVVGAELVYLLSLCAWWRQSRRLAREGLMATGAAVALFVPWFISITTYAGESSTWRGFIGIWDMLRVLAVNFASQAHLPNGLNDWLALLLALAGALGALSWNSWRRSEQPALGSQGSGARTQESPLGTRQLLLLWLLLPIAAVYGLSFKEPLFSPRYFIVVLPALLLLVGAGLAKLPRAGGYAALAVLAAGSVWAVERGNTVPSYAKEDYRLAASYIGQRSTPEDAIALLANYIIYPFQYYFHGAGQVIPLDVQPDSDLDPILTPLAEHDHIWLVEGHDVFVDPRGRVGAWLRARYPVEDEKYIIAIHFTEFDTRPVVPGLPASATRLDAKFVDGPSLAGYTIEPDRLTKVTLYWGTNQPEPRDYHISLKLWDGQGKLAGQQDGEPLNAGLPFTKFPSQGLVRDEHFIAARPGTYDLIMSVYMPGSADVPLADGDTQLKLGQVQIR